MIKEIFYDESYCKKCTTRRNKRRAVEQRNDKIQSCKCGVSQYYCWRTENIDSDAEGFIKQFRHREETQ